MLPKSDISIKIFPLSLPRDIFASSQANKNISTKASMMNTSDMGFVKAALVVSGDVKK
ncbi:MAG: hypothetical protein H3C47_08030 [Candidatus Cloacimonetes bacterium]|nr:hypothetical protein [Candidatus Cloacimonadota bacterium]